MIAMLLLTCSLLSAQQAAKGRCGWECLEVLLLETGHVDAAIKAAKEQGDFNTGISGQPGSAAGWLARAEPFGVPSNWILSNNFTFEKRDADDTRVSPLPLMKKAVAAKHKVLLVIGEPDAKIGHAVILVGMDEKDAKVIDLNHPGEEKKIPLADFPRLWRAGFIVFSTRDEQAEFNK